MLKRNWKSRALAVMVASALATVAYGNVGYASDDGPIKIGVPVGLTGSNAVIAPGVVQAAELAQDEINAAGGILGRKVELKFYDDQSGADGALKAFNTAVLQDKVIAIASMETTAARNAGLPVTQKMNIPFVYSSQYEGRACSPNLFINGSVPEQTGGVVDYFTKKTGAKTWFLVGSDYAYARESLAAYRKMIEDVGGTVVAMEFNPMDSPDWTAILQKIRSAKPDVVASAFAGGAPNVTFFKQWRDGGFSLPHLSLGIEEGTALNLGSAAAGVVYPSSYFTTVESEENKAYLAALKKKYGDKMELPNYLSVPQYEGIHLLAKAIEKAGSTDSAAIIEALPIVSFKGPSGVTQINRQHHAPLHIYVGEIQSDGSTKVIHDFGLVSPGDQCPNL
jgi:branched-chain amino acid transport system substrate-binding protein